MIVLIGMENLINPRFLELKAWIIKEKVTALNLDRLNAELFYLECNDTELEYVLNSFQELKKKNLKTKNKNNSLIYYVCGFTDVEPSLPITQTPTTLPDVDFDTAARDETKKYLQDEYGVDNVSLLGTYNTLKTKGAIKDAAKSSHPELGFDAINEITKKFGIKRTDEETVEKLLEGKPAYDLIKDYSSELAFYYANIENDSSLKTWFLKYPKLNDAIPNLLGNARSTGIHAGGIVVSSVDIKTILPLTWEREEMIWVTQPEMGDVEESGLIKFDFLGLKTLKQQNICRKLIKSRHGIDLNLSHINYEDKEVFKEFILGNVSSVFQYDSDLVIPTLRKLKEITSVMDLAIITAIHRPGPMESGIIGNFIRRKNGEEEITYLHPSLESHLKDTYGLIVLQESVMSIVQDLGGISPDESVVVLKAMSKKLKDKLHKYKDQFIKNCFVKYNIETELASTIWGQIESFAEYGFNKSHALAYACIGYACLYLKKYYPLEWMSAVLETSEDDDFRYYYSGWKDFIQKPIVNASSGKYRIDYENNKVVMPLSAIKGVGDKAVSELDRVKEKIGSFTSLKNIYESVDKRKANRACFMNLILAGAMDCFKDTDVSEFKFRKRAVHEYLSLRHKDKNPGKDEHEKDSNQLKEICDLSNIQMTNKEIELLNFSPIDYHTQYKDYFEGLAARRFGSVALKASEVKNMPNEKSVVIGGSVLEINERLIKKEGSKLKGRKMLVIKIQSGGETAEVVIFPGTIDEDAKRNNDIPKIVSNVGLIVSGKISIFNDRVSVIYNEGIVLT